MRKIIILKLKGGLGNQLFSYAFSLHLANLNHANLYIDIFTGFKYDKVYNRSFALENFNITANILPSNFYNKHFNPFVYRITKKIILKTPFLFQKYLIEKSICFDNKYLEYKIRNKCYIDGYFQSEKYFSNIDHIIRKEFKIKEPIDVENVIMSNLIKSKKESVMIHIRWFDKNINNSKNNAAKEYYSLAIEYLKKRNNNLHFFVFSDDSNLAKTLIEKLNVPFTIVSHNNSESKAYADLWLMSLCKYFIIANSTFSWWGAWLSENEDKIIIAPKMKVDGLSSWGFNDLIPKSWIQL